MGCSSSEQGPSLNYAISYCQLHPIKDNKYKIILLSREEVPRITDAKFFSQVGSVNSSEEIINFIKRETFNKKTIFYLYENNLPEIKNLFYMLNFIPNDKKQLHDIFLLSTDKVKDYPNCLVEKKTQELNFFKFIGKEIDMSDMNPILDKINDVNITKDDIDYEEEDKEKIDAIHINGVINENSRLKFEKVFNENKNIIKVFVSDIELENKNSFFELMKFFQNKNIKLFSLYDMNINNTDLSLFYSILELIEKNYSIRNIDFHNCNLKDINLNDLLRAISDKRIRFLNLSKNDIKVEGASLISEYLFVNKTMQKLDISHNNSTLFKAEGIEYIKRALIKSVNIKYFNISDMTLTGCGKFISEILNENKSLETLIMRKNDLNTNDFKLIFNAVKENNNIKEIDVSFNDLGGDKIFEYISDCIKFNTNLIELRMDKIGINNDNYITLFEGIENNKNIVNYTMNYNAINIKIVLEFFIKQKQVKYLEFIPFDKNLAENKNKDLTLDDKKSLEKCKIERPDLDIITLE